MSTDEENEIDVLTKRLSSRREVMISDLRKLVPECSDLEWRLMLHRARKLMRERKGIEFISRGDRLIVANAKQRLNRGLGFRRTGLRKVKTSLDVLNVVDERELTTDDKATLEAARARGDRIYMAMATELRARKIDPATLPEKPIEADPRRAGK